MKKSNSILIQSGNIISSKENKEKKDFSNLDGLFSKEYKSDYDSSDHKPGKKEIRGRQIKKDKSWETIKENTKHTKESNINSDEKIFSKDKKRVEDWVSALKGFSDKDISLKGIVSASRSGKETNNFGRSTLIGPNKTSIFNPDAISKLKNSKMTDAVINDARSKRKENESKKERSRDWETPSIAKSSKDFKAGQMGFTPNRNLENKNNDSLAYSEEIENVKKNIIKNEKNAEKALNIANEIKNSFINKMESQFKDERSWEQKKIEEIANVQKKSYSVEDFSVKIAKDFVSTKKDIDKGKISNLRDIFSFSNDPEKIKKEIDIKRKSEITQKHKKREDDRSWEKVLKPKTTKI